MASLALGRVMIFGIFIGVGRIMCWLGLHDDGTDVFGWYSPTCLRCDKRIYP